MLYALGFIGLFTIGGLTGLFLACLAFDVHVTDTYFVVAHFHYIMVGGMVTAYFGGLHYWWPKITGRMYPEYWARAAAILIFFGFNLTFFPQFILGVLGMPRRYHVYPPEFQVWNVLSSAGASILAARLSAAAVLSRLVAVLGPRAPRRIPWNATGLEWQTPSPPPKHNFADDAGGDARTLSTIRRTARRCRRMPEAHPASAIRRLCAQQRDAAQLGMWVFLATEVLFFGGLILRLFRLSHRLSGRLRRGRAPHQDRHRHDQHRDSADQQLSRGVGGDGRAARRRPPGGSPASRRGPLGLVFSWSQGVEYREEYREHLVPALDFSYPGANAGSVSFSSFSISSRPACTRCMS